MRCPAALLVLLLAAPLAAQDPDPWRGGIPDAVTARIDALLADPATLRLTGTHAIAANRTIEGSVVAEGGLLSIGGTVRGQVVMLGGDLLFEPGARVDGDVLVVDGEVRGERDASLSGSLTVYGPPAADRAHRDRRHWGADERWERSYGDADFTLGVEGNYNRVEGLPLAFGPEVRTAGPLPLRLEALAIWRTDAGPLTETDRMGYVARAEQHLPAGIRVGGSVRSTVDPIEAWGMEDGEASLATALLHRDQRDYFEREGWSAWLRFAPRRSPLDARVEYRDERHTSLAARDPWTLFYGDDLWRGQPLVAEGDRQSLVGRLELDGVRGWDFHRLGWYAALEVEHALDGTLVVPQSMPDGASLPPLPQPHTFEAGGTTALVDLRAFQRAGLGGVLGARLVAGGGLEKGPVAPQYQHALGGSGSLPGYGLFSADCGARGVWAQSLGTSGLFYASYGCHRFALLQLEYRGGFDIHVGRDGEGGERRRWWRRGDVDVDVDWTFFFDAGRGATYGADGGTLVDTGGLYDVGAGIILGDIGIYGAAPLTGEDRDLRFFLRVGPRF